MEEARSLNDIRRIARFLEVTTRRLMAGALAGDFRTRSVGQGIDFDQLREYHEGDEVRMIDWKSSARANKLMVRQFHHEHTRTVMILMDGSASTHSGSARDLVSHAIAYSSAALALAAQLRKDRVGLMIFCDEVITHIPPAAGRAHVQRIVDTILAHEPVGKTSVSRALRTFLSRYRRSTLSFIISDFFDDNFQALLASADKRHDIVACFVNEQNSFGDGWVSDLFDPETRQTVLGGTVSASQLATDIVHARESHKKALSKTGVETVTLDPTGDYLSNLVHFFARRARSH